ncbi:MAG TPA: WG repeat-containing protein, partial [Vicinamibacterales bacterium]|nr:WG repeat-containing protein [Vicinamibacterales bacterium]
MAEMSGETMNRFATAVVVTLLAVAAPTFAGTGRTAQDSVVLLPETARKPAPAIILLPFTGGDAQRLYDWRYADLLAALAEELGLIVVVPPGEGSTDNYSTGAAWSHTLQDYTDRIGRDADELVSRFGADPKQLFLAGYSMGGDLAWALPQRDPGRYAGAIVMGSRSTYRDKAGLEKLAKQGFRYYMFMGEYEVGARISGMADARATLQRVGVPFEPGSAPEDNIPAPPEVFDRAVHYLLGVPMPNNPRPMPAPRASVESPLAMPEVEPPGREPALPGGDPGAPTDCDWTPYTDPRIDAFPASPLGQAKNVGYKDARGQVVVSPRFTDADPFSDGLAAVYVDYDAGYINCNGKVFDVHYDEGADVFSDDLVRYERGSAMGYRDRTGRIVIPARFGYGSPFCRGVAQVADHCAIDREDGDIVGLRCTAWYFIDQKGRRAQAPDGWQCPEDDGTADEGEGNEDAGGE